MDFLLPPFACRRFVFMERITGTRQRNGRTRPRHWFKWSKTAEALAKLAFICRICRTLDDARYSNRGTFATGCMRGPSFIHDLTQKWVWLTYCFRMSRGGLKQIDLANFQIQVSTTRGAGCSRRVGFQVGGQPTQTLISQKSSHGVNRNCERRTERGVKLASVKLRHRKI
jgi:hypothetical protein